MLGAAELDPTTGPRRRIALVITRSDAVGGAQIAVELLAIGLRDAGHDVRVFVGGDGPFVGRLAERGVSYTSLRHLVRPIAPVTDARGLAELRAALEAYGPDLISAHSTKAGWLARLVAWRMGIPSVFTAHGWPLSPGRLAPSRLVVAAAERAAASVANELILVSDYDRRVAREHHVGQPHQHTVVHNALPDVPPDLRACLAGAPPRVLMVARLERPKDPLLAVRALARVADLPWHFELIGDGPLRPQIETALSASNLSSRVTLAGVRDDVPQRLAASDVFLLASRREGLPLSVLEAMRAGLPVVATDAGGVCEAVVDGETGLVCPRDDVEALATALRSVLSEASTRRAMGEAGRRRYEAAFSFSGHLRRVWAVYARAMAGG